MRESYVISQFIAMEKRIEVMKRKSGGADQELVTLRLQTNAIIRMLKWAFPLNLIFKHLVKKEYSLYVEQLDKRKKQLEDMKNKIAMSKTPFFNHVDGKMGRNEKCYCGSGKKYKKCCIDKKDDIKVPPTPGKPVDDVLNKDIRGVVGEKETLAEYVARKGMTGNE